MIIIKDENSINKTSVIALSKTSKQEKITPLDVIRFYHKYGILIPNKQEVERLEKMFGLP
jgi:hypothetical protein